MQREGVWQWLVHERATTAVICGTVWRADHVVLRAEPPQCTHVVVGVRDMLDDIGRYYQVCLCRLEISLRCGSRVWCSVDNK